MVVTLGELVNADQALARLAEQKLPIKVSWLLGKLVKRVREEVAEFHTHRNAWIQELGQTEDGRTWTIEAGSSNQAEFTKRLSELVALEVELAWVPLQVSALGSIEVSVADLIVLEPFLVED